MLLHQPLITPIHFHRRDLAVETGDDLFMPGVLQADQNVQAVLAQWPVSYTHLTLPTSDLV